MINSQRLQNILSVVRPSLEARSHDVSLRTVFQELTDFFRFPQIDGQSENAKLIWLVRLRWAAICLFFLMAGPGYILGALNRNTITIFIGAVGILLIFNLFTHLVFVGSRKPIGSLFISF